MTSSTGSDGAVAVEADLVAPFTISKSIIETQDDNFDTASGVDNGDGGASQKDSKYFADQGEKKETAEDPASQENPEIKKKKKRSKNRKGGKSAAKRGPTAMPASRGSGFEEYFADPPITPDEARQEKDDVYGLNVSFEERMQSCVQRFRSRRRLQQNHTLYFNEYLFLGGIDSQPNAFGGLDQEDLKGLTPAQRRDATAHDVVYGGSAGGDRFYDGNPDHWTVDFAGIAAGFISVTMPRLTGLRQTDVDQAVGVVENFLRYVLQHDACPEYNDNVREALRVCTNARIEWPVVDKLRTAMPGVFNLAAAELFCGEEFDPWASHGFARPEGFCAADTFACSWNLIKGKPTAENATIKQMGKITREVECAVEFKTITRADEDRNLAFQNYCREGYRLLEPFEPIGTATVVRTTIENGWATVPHSPELADDEEVLLYLSDPILARLKPGMKVPLCLCQVGGEEGMWFIKTSGELLPTFYTFLPQELMRGFKSPRENERPAPSIHDAVAEDNAASEDDRAD